MALNIIFMGTPEFAVPILKSLYESKHNILEVYTQPPKKRDRGQKLNLTSIHTFSKKNNIKVRYPEKIDTKEEYERLKKLKPDVVVVVAYGKIIPQQFLDIKSIRFLNIHASLLPKWRGAAPIQRAIMNLDNETGISIMQIVSKLDSGPIMMKSKIKISKYTKYKKLSEQLSNLGSSMIIDSLNLIESKAVKFIEQNDKDATYAKKIDKKETKIDWKDEAKIIIGKINAFSPSPGCWFKYQGVRVKIIDAKEVDASGTPGQIINKNFTIACSKNAIQILELQKEGKKIMSAIDFLKGNEIEIGSKLT